MTDESLGRRLRRERERRHIPLSSIAANTKIGVSLLQSLERDDVSRWPSGIYRRSFIRLYAEAIGLDPTEVAEEFFARHPDPGDEQGVATARPRPAGSGASSWSTGSASSGWGGSDGSCHAPLRLTFAPETTTTPHLGPVAVPRDLTRRTAAAVADLTVIAALAIGLLPLVGLFWAAVGIASVGYYAVSAIALGTTPGLFLVTRRQRIVSASRLEPDLLGLPPEQAEPSFLDLRDLSGVRGLSGVRSGAVSHPLSSTAD